METHTFSEKDKTVCEYKILDSISLKNNVDRVKFIKGSVDKNYLLSASYHLDKLTGNKSGALNINNFGIDCKLSNVIEETTDYGILDIKLNFENSPTDFKLFTSNSDYSFSIFNLDLENVINPFELKQKFHIQNEEFVYNPKETCNTLDIKNLGIDSTILLAMNDGCHCIFDMTKEKSVTIKKSHEYGLWSCMVKDINTFYTGSEDSLFKMWDRRSESKAIGINKSHNASINCIQNLSNEENSNYIITGSYDEAIRIIDVRKFNQCVYKKKLDCSIWDLNQVRYRNKNLLLMSCVYEGFNVFEIDVDKILSSKSESESDLRSINNLLSFPLEKEGEEGNVGKTLNHKTIVYGVDSAFLNNEIDQLYVTSCSFYDNTIVLWKILC